MAKGVVFKQWYKPMNEKSTPELNGRHLIYIATRPGAIHNKDCAFGLFGRLPDMETAEDINNLKAAHRVITATSHRRTIYRAVFSVDDETAKAHGLYSRDEWQKLIIDKIGVLAGEHEMDIACEDFCWAASMHYEKGHPHVHVLYWDNGNKVRQECMSPERFEIMAEKVRAEFSRELVRQAVIPKRAEQREVLKTARLELMAMFKELNVMDALNLKRISQEKLCDLGQQAYNLILSCPKKGSFKYDEMPADYKARFNTFLEELMKIRDFSKLRQRYLDLSGEVSDLYGNGDKGKEHYREKAGKEFERGMGNELMAFISAYKKSVAAELPAELEQMKEVIRDDTQLILPTSIKYAELQRMMPRYRMPLEEIMTPEFAGKKDALVKELMSDVRIRMKINLFIKSEIKTRNLGSDSAEDESVISKEVYGQFFKVTGAAVMESLYSAAGYDKQIQSDMAVNMLVELFGSMSQRVNQCGSRFQLNKQTMTRDKSKTALKEKQKQREQQGYWEPEM